MLLLPPSIFPRYHPGRETQRLPLSIHSELPALHGFMLKGTSGYYTICTDTLLGKCLRRNPIRRARSRTVDPDAILYTIFAYPSSGDFTCMRLNDGRRIGKTTSKTQDGWTFCIYLLLSKKLYTNGTTYRACHARSCLGGK